MPNGTGLDPRVERGEVCAKCKVEFDGGHGKPVLCANCHDVLRPQFTTLPKAWLEEKAK